MTILREQHFRVTIDMAVAVQAIDDDLITTIISRNPQSVFAREEHVRPAVARERRVLDALLADRTLLLQQMLRRILWELDEIKPVEGTEHDLGVAHDDLADRALVRGLKPALSADDFAYLMDLVDVGLFIDNMSFYYEAFRTSVGTVAIEHIEASQTSDTRSMS